VYDPDPVRNGSLGLVLGGIINFRTSGDPPSSHVNGIPHEFRGHYDLTRHHVKGVLLDHQATSDPRDSSADSSPPSLQDPLYALNLNTIKYLEVLPF